MGYERYPRNDRGGYDDRAQRQRDGRDDTGYRSSSRDDAYGTRDPRYGEHQEFRTGESEPSRYRRDGGFQDRGAYGRDEHGPSQRFSSGDRGGYAHQPHGYDQDDRGFFDRAGDEVRSWFGDEDANRRRDQDARRDEHRYGAERDDHYHNWRRGQIDALDRDYDEYRRENRTKFDTEFGSWRSQRQGQRDSLSKVEEHMEVVGSDGAHVGKVDKVRGDRIILTKNDTDVGGRHHSIPSRWIRTVDDKVTIEKTADDAKRQWKDEERNQAFFSEQDGHREQARDGAREQDPNGPHVLGRSFSGTY